MNWKECIARTPPDLWDPQSDGWGSNLALLAADVWAFGTFMWEVRFLHILVAKYFFFFAPTPLILLMLITMKISFSLSPSLPPSLPASLPPSLPLSLPLQIFHFCRKKFPLEADQTKEEAESYLKYSNLPAPTPPSQEYQVPKHHGTMGQNQVILRHQ